MILVLLLIENLRAAPLIYSSEGTLPILPVLILFLPTLLLSSLLNLLLIKSIPLLLILILLLLIMVPINSILLSLLNTCRHPPPPIFPPLNLPLFYLYVFGHFLSSPCLFPFTFLLSPSPSSSISSFFPFPLLH